MRINQLSNEETKEVLYKCCGCQNWVERMLSSLPFDSKEILLEKSDNIWNSLTEIDWKNAFASHPKIGDINSLESKFSQTKDLAENEQARVNEASAETLTELSKLNSEYEKKFGYIFIVCATGKSADEMLKLIRERINNDAETEIKIAANEQRKITKLRLEKLL